MVFKPIRRNNRDLYVDLLRGCALAIIFIDHIDGHILARFTPYQWAYCDMAEVFVFLSGYVGGLVYHKHLATQSFLKCQRKALIRSFQIYIAQIVTVLLFFAGIFAIGASRPGLIMLANLTDYMDMSQNYSVDILWSVLTLNEMPRKFTILPLYMILVPAVPLVVRLITRNTVLVMLASALLYCVAQYETAYTHVTPSETLNPLGWQFLFVIGILCSVRNPLSSLSKRTRRILMIGSLLVLEIAFLAKLYLPQPNNVLVGKENLVPVRLIHFLFFAFLVMQTKPYAVRFIDQPISKILIVCGQNALIAYCAGGLASTLACILLALFGYSLISQLTIAVGCFTVMMGAVWLWSIGKRLVWHDTGLFFAKR